MNLLAFLRRPAPPRAEPPLEALDGAGRDEVAPLVVPGRLRWEEPEPADLAEEELLLDEVAGLVAEGVSPWDAAVRVFGGAPGTVGAGLCATVAGEGGGSVPR